MKAILCIVVALLVCQSVSAEVATEDLKGFAKWLGENGVETKVNLGIFGESRFGGVAATEIKSGDGIIKIPSKLLISAEVISQDPIITQYKDWTLHNEPWVLWLLRESIKPDSFWQPYFKVLPKEFKDHPLYWSEDELKELQSSPGRSNIAALQQTVKASYDNLKKKLVDENPQLFPEGYFTFDRFVWAFLCAQTRQWGLTTGNVWVPLADMLNHKSTAGHGGMNQEGTHFVINATQEYGVGDQVYDSYGPKSSEELLRVYGFVPEENEQDHVKLNIQSTAINLVQSIVTPVLDKADRNWRDVYLIPNTRSDTLLRAFRVNQLEFKELEHLNDVVAGKPVSLLNELRAYRSAISVLSQLLQSYSTTVEDDAELLKKENLPARQLSAVRLRHKEKVIIRNQILVIGKLWENILIEGTLPGGVPVR